MSTKTNIFHESQTTSIFIDLIFNFITNNPKFSLTGSIFHKVPEAFWLRTSLMKAAT